MKSKFCGYVLDNVDYKDNDSIVTILSKDGLLSMKARGVKKITSKMKGVVTNFAFSEFEVNESEKNGYLTLINGKLIEYPSYVINSLEYITLLNIVSEGISKCSFNEKTFNLFKDVLNLMKENVSYKKILIIFLNVLLEGEGIKYFVDGCIECGSKSVNGFSYFKAGFICRKCGAIASDITYLQSIRYLAKLNFTNFDKINVSSEQEKEYIVNTFTSLEEKAGISFKSKEFLLKILN